MINVALFASGSGSNVENIFNYFKNSKEICIKCVLCNNKNAFVLERCKRLELEFLLFDRQDFNDCTKILTFLTQQNIDFIILAGFLWLVPKLLINRYKNKIINIHPALLPKFGGKGMYGDNVHKAVFANKETETGITVHFVNEKYDDGCIIEQQKVAISPNDTVESIAEKVHSLEYQFFPQIIKTVILS